MSEKEPIAVPQVEADSSADKARIFWEKNSKAIIYGLTAIVVLVGGWFAYKYLIVAPKEKKAQETVYKAEQYFGQDSLQKALKGDGSNKGFLYVIDNYGGTKTGNLAKYYAGISYLRLKDFNNAVKYLKDFSTDAKQVEAMSYSALGDAYAELNKKDDALSAYKKAAHTFEKDENLSAELLYKAGLFCETLSKNDEAVALYKEIKEKYPKTDRGFQADKYIYRLSVQKNEFSVKE